MMARYSEEFKYSIVKKMMPPDNQSVSQIARETGLSEATLFNWKKQARAKGMAVPGGEQEASRLQKELRQKNNEYKKLEKELRRKEAALAETAALLDLRKKANAIWGDGEDA